jgi:hypothetical protein
MTTLVATMGSLPVAARSGAARDAEWVQQAAALG